METSPEPTKSVPLPKVAPNPFTPQSGWEPKVFGGRQEILERFETLLQESLRLSPQHLVVLGDWGIGKTALLKQFKKVVQTKGAPASFCAVNRLPEKSTLEEATLLLAQEILFGYPMLSDAGVLLNGLQAVSPKKKGSVKRLILQPQLALVQFLLQLWSNLKTPLAVVLLDDIQNFEATSHIIDLLRAVLSHEDIVQKTRYLFILATTPEGWRTFLDKHDPVGRFFRKREILQTLNRQETFSLIDLNLKDTGVVFEEEVKDKIFDVTRGHPYEIQLLASHLYDAQLEGKVALSVWEGAFQRTLRELGEDYFEAILRRASDREYELLEVLAQKKRPMSIQDLRQTMIFEKRKRTFPVDNIKNFLYRLETKGLIRRLQDGDFELLDPMLGEFILMERGTPAVKP